MKKNMTELVFILDRSGSMSGLEDDTIGGFNGMLKKQKEGSTDVNVTTVLFDDQIDFIHDRFPIEIVQPLTEKDYFVRGCTALLDAIGDSMRKIENVQEHLPAEYKSKKVIFVITTDGHENSSKRYSYHQIKKMVEAKREIGWEFIFLGANIDAIGEAEKMGINRDRAVAYENDQKGIELNFKAVGSVLKRAIDSNYDEDDCVREAVFSRETFREVEGYKKEADSKRNRKVGK
jgi:uncharacterized protein YegL